VFKSLFNNGLFLWEVFLVNDVWKMRILTVYGLEKPLNLCKVVVGPAIFVAAKNQVFP